MLNTFLVSTGVVAIAEIGDKTQLLALILAARYRQPVSVILGIFTATIINHGLAAYAGSMIAAYLTPSVLKIGLGLGFVAMAAWALIPDKAEDDDAPAERAGAFIATTIAFFLVEMGDKTQIATIALGARFQDVLTVAAGTTFGMMLANVPAVLVGDAATKMLPLNLVRATAAVIFALLGLVLLLDFEAWRGVLALVGKLGSPF